MTLPPTGQGTCVMSCAWRRPRPRRPPLDGGDGQAVTALHRAADGAVAGFKAGASYFTPVALLRPDGDGRWTETPIPVGEAFLTRSRPGPGGTIVAAGQRPRNDLTSTDPLFVVIEDMSGMDLYRDCSGIELTAKLTASGFEEVPR